MATYNRSLLFSFLTRKDQYSSAQLTACSNALSSSWKSVHLATSSSSQAPPILNTPLLPVPLATPNRHALPSVFPWCLEPTPSWSWFHQLFVLQGLLLQEGSLILLLRCGLPTKDHPLAAPVALLSSQWMALDNRSPLSTLFMMVTQHCLSPLLLLLPGL
jgi:hypothetical protein